jgi:hypothetical protein
VVVAIASCRQLLTDFRLGILELRLEQTELLELDLELLGGLLVLAVVVRHDGRVMCDLVSRRGIVRYCLAFGRHMRPTLCMYRDADKQVVSE